MANVYIGIDPGASGGIAYYYDHRLAGYSAMPDCARDFLDYTMKLMRFADIAVAVVEKVGGYHKGNPTPGSAMFRFGVNYGMVLMALEAAGVDYHEVSPQRWQRSLGISPRGKGEDRIRWKNRLKDKAQQLFPGHRVTLATADALLIAYYCRKEYGNE